MEQKGDGAMTNSPNITVLTEGCISEILSLTSPWDACRAAAVSPEFRSATDSDAIWERFMPSDCRQIISRSISPPRNYSTTKQLYFLLCDSPILLDQGNLSFSLHKKSGKKCYMVGARRLSIVWGGATQYWKWKPRPDSRFSDVAELGIVWWLHISGQLRAGMLSPKTTYEAYFVYKLSENSYGLDSAKVSIRFTSDEGDVKSSEWITAYLGASTSETPEPNTEYCRRRNDGWMEIKTGEFENGDGDDGVVETQFMEIEQLHEKGGLIVEGIEFRPKES